MSMSAQLQPKGAGMYVCWGAGTTWSLVRPCWPSEGACPDPQKVRGVLSQCLESGRVPSDPWQVGGLLVWGSVLRIGGQGHDAGRWRLWGLQVSLRTRELEEICKSPWGPPEEAGAGVGDPARHQGGTAREQSPARPSWGSLNQPTCGHYPPQGAVCHLAASTHPSCRQPSLQT